MNNDETMDFIFFVIWQNVIKSKDRVENEGRYFNSFNYMILTIFLYPGEKINFWQSIQTILELRNIVEILKILDCL